MDTTTLNNAFEELDRLSQEEYKLSLREVLDEPVVGDSDPAVDRIGRLGGVLLKQPFAGDPVTLSEPSTHADDRNRWRKRAYVGRRIVLLLIVHCERRRADDRHARCAREAVFERLGWPTPRGVRGLACHVGFRS